jgi:SnoaL-like domain
MQEVKQSLRLFATEVLSALQKRNGIRTEAAEFPRSVMFGSEEMGQMTLEARVVFLENVREIEQLKYRYARCCDSGYDLDGFRSIFVPDGMWSANGFGEYHGHQEICDFFQELSQSVVDVLHYVTSPHITIAEDGRTATGTFYLLCLSRFRRKEDKKLIDFVVMMGVYDDTFVKTDTGWRFASIKVNVMHVNKLDTQPETTVAQGVGP